MPRKSTRQKGKRKRGRPPKKKTGTRKRKVSKKPLIHKDAPEPHYFILCNGRPVRNVKELADIMEELEDHVFNYHIRPDGNDFAKWVKDIFKDIELAEKIAGVKDKKHLQLVIYKHITHKLW